METTKGEQGRKVTGLPETGMSLFSYYLCFLIITARFCSVNCSALNYPSHIWNVAVSCHLLASLWSYVVPVAYMNAYMPQFSSHERDSRPKSPALEF